MQGSQEEIGSTTAGRMLDRLLLLRQHIPAEEVLQVLRDTGCIDSRRCTLSFEVTCWVVLATGLLCDMPIRAVFKAAVSLHQMVVTPARSSLCEARQRLGIPPLRRLFYRLARPLAGPDTPGCFYRGLRLMAIDGVSYTVPDSPANARAFGRATSGARGEAAFPQVRKVSLVELGTHAEIACAFKRRRCGEPAMAAGLVRHLPADALLLADRHFYSFPLWKRLHARGIPCLWRVSAKLVLRPRRALADGSYLARVYRKPYERDADRNGIDVRVIRYTLDDPQRAGHGEGHTLLTSLLDAAAAPALELIALYHERWEQELVYDEQKTHLDPRRAHKPAALRSATPAGVLQELYALSLGHYVVRALMAAAAAPAGLDPDRLSFTGCVQVLRCRLPECPSHRPAAAAAWFDALLAEMRHEQTEPRRNRINPRVVKQKVKHWAKKRPEHRGIPPLRKCFIESVVMIT